MVVSPIFAVRSWRAVPRANDEWCGGNFVGAVLENASLPILQHGAVALVKSHGPVLLYQIGEHPTVFSPMRVALSVFYMP